ncbi:MAG: hypothetical protein JWN53_841 [Gemmatimonadetes bacterium]|nr:hypothetical protein [Gemmatimonadota bacterium]
MVTDGSKRRYDERGRMTPGALARNIALLATSRAS